MMGHKNLWGTRGGNGETFRRVDGSECIKVKKRRRRIKSTAENMEGGRRKSYPTTDATPSAEQPGRAPTLSASSSSRSRSDAFLDSSGIELVPSTASDETETAASHT